MENIAHPTFPVMEVKEVFAQMWIEYEQEKIFYTENSFYIADFYIPSKNIIIEIDGKSHIWREKKDKIRDDWFLSQWIVTKRYSNKNATNVWSLFKNKIEKKKRKRRFKRKRKTN